MLSSCVSLAPLDPSVGRIQEYEHVIEIWNDPVIHLSPSLQGNFLFRYIKSAWYDEAEAGHYAVGTVLLIREQEGETVVQYLTERTERGWVRHMVAYRRDEESPYPYTERWVR